MRGTNFFRFVVNPDSFGQTVENMFYLSFLVRDGKAAIEAKDDGEIMITARYGNDEDGEEQGAEAGKKTQTITEFDMETWQVGYHCYPSHPRKIRGPQIAEIWGGVLEWTTWCFVPATARSNSVVIVWWSVANRIQMAIDTFDITKSVIPNREPKEYAAPAAGSWM